jgi:hypothetical protein
MIATRVKHTFGCQLVCSFLASINRTADDTLAEHKSDSDLEQEYMGGIYDKKKIVS